MFKKTILFFLVFILANKVFAQASWEQFGQNRVQYRTFDWNYFDSTNFRTFYYDQGKPNALYALNMAEKELNHIVYLMGGRLNKKLNIVIYNSFSDYRQTNIGRKNEAINEANGGKLEVIGDVIPIYFDGDHNHLKKQLLKGVTSVIKDNMLFGDNIKEIVKNAVKMNLPEWYTLGYVTYISDDWTPEKLNELNNMIMHKPKASISEYGIENATLIGHSFWRFIAMEYGENQLSNLLYFTRYRKSVNNAIPLVFKKSAKQFFEDWKLFYAKNYITDSLKDSVRTLLVNIPIKKGVSYSNFETSITGREVAYVEKKDGQFVVKVYDSKFNKIKNVLEGEVRSMQELADPNYPLIAWSPSGRKIAVLYSKNNLLYVKIFSTDKGKSETKYISRNKIERITGMSFMNDDFVLGITGIKKGQSDLYRLLIKNKRVENITKDLFDDKNPSVVQDGTQSGILFLSNRTSDYIGENSKSDQFNDQFNLFLYQPSKGNNLLQLSNTKKELKYPIQWGNDEISYLIEENGKLERKIITTEKRDMKGDTFLIHSSIPVLPNLISQEFVPKTGNVIEVCKNYGSYQIFSSKIDSLKKYDKLYFKNHIDSSTTSSSLNDTMQVANVEYNTPYEDDSTNSELEDIFLQKVSTNGRYQNFKETLKKIKAKPYKPTFNPDFLQATLDNTLLFTRYQVFNSSNPSYQNPPLSGFLTSMLTDIMEDYKLTGGARLGADFTTIDYFLKLNNFRKRTDWELLYYHHGNKSAEKVPVYISPYNILNKNTLDYFQGKYTYPFDVMRSINMQLGVRLDRTETLAMDKYSIAIPSSKLWWAVSRVEYIYDNSISPIPNIRKGSRAKLFAEYQYKLNDGGKGFYNFGYDGRTYSPLYKNVILASRIAGACSGGNAKILYKVGGVDNDLNPKQDANTVIDLTQNYAFQSLATNLRGYKQGYRNGNSYLVVNEEVRLPVYNTFFKRPIKSGFIRNLQVIAFVDAGSSWKGVFPNSDNIKSQNIVKDSNSNVTVFLINNKKDFGVGYGFGFRSKILGYFLRTDFAWNIEGLKKPMIHISMATDF